MTTSPQSAEVTVRPIHVQDDQFTELTGDLALPANPTGIVLFVHGSGSSRHSPRNQGVASYLQQQGPATLLFDLLTAREEVIDIQTAELRFDISLLAGRVITVAEWLRTDPQTRDLPVGLFGASTGAAAALVAATERPHDISAIVSRGGRPDLAGEALPQVTAPTLLIVGGEDVEVLELNEDAFRSLRCQKELRIVRGATHLFEEPGALEQVALLAGDWFERHLRRR